MKTLKVINNLKNRFQITSKIYLFLFFTLVLKLTNNSLLESKINYKFSGSDIEKCQNSLINVVTLEDIEKTKNLINANHDLNKKSQDGYTPLMAAAYTGNVEIIKLLITAGAKLELYDNSGNTALMYAFLNTDKKEATVECLLSFGANTQVMSKENLTPLILAASMDDCKSIGLLIAGGAKIETKGFDGMTALMSAVSEGNLESVKCLIQYGADIETRDRWSFTPLMEAVFCNNGPMVRILIEAGSDINAHTTQDVSLNFSHESIDIKEGSTALDIAKRLENRSAEYALLGE